MKILQINSVYKYGSTGKIVYDLHRAIEDHGDVSVVCYGRRELYREENVHKVCPEWYSKGNQLLTWFSGRMYGGCIFSTAYLLAIIRREKPDIVHLHCINGYFVNIYHLIDWLKKQRIRTVLTLHAEFMYTANCGHAYDCERWKTGCGDCPRLREETRSLFLDGTAASWKRMKRAFSGFSPYLTVVSVSPWLQRRAQSSPILADMTHAVVPNGVDTEIFRIRRNAALEAEYPGAYRAVVLHPTARFSPEPAHPKGGYYVIALAKRMPDVLFLVAGEADVHEVLPENIRLLGFVADQVRLAEYYTLADAVLLTSRRETFGMAVAEALCCGTPVVGFKAGGPESIALPECTAFCEYGDLDGLHCLLNHVLCCAYDPLTVSETAKDQFSIEEMYCGYHTIYHQ